MGVSNVFSLNQYIVACPRQFYQRGSDFAVDLRDIMWGQMWKLLLRPRRHRQHTSAHGAQHARPLRVDTGRVARRAGWRPAAGCLGCRGHPALPALVHQQPDLPNENEYF